MPVLCSYTRIRFRLTTWKDSTSRINITFPSPGHHLQRFQQPQSLQSSSLGLEIFQGSRLLDGPSMEETPKHLRIIMAPHHLNLRFLTRKIAFRTNSLKLSPLISTISTLISHLVSPRPASRTWSEGQKLL